MESKSSVIGLQLNAVVQGGGCKVGNLGHSTYVCGHTISLHGQLSLNFLSEQSVQDNRLL